MTREGTDRKLYEQITRKFRFDLYKSTLKTSGCSGVILGHHDDDVSENVVMNLMNGRSLLDLSVIKEESVNDSVLLLRPLMGHPKSMVYDFATNHFVPYFKDTTPAWSMRGKFRNEVLPLLDDTYKQASSRLKGIALQSEEWNELINARIIKPFIDKCVVYDESSQTYTVDASEHVAVPVCFWKTVFAQLCHRAKVPAPSAKCIATFCERLRANSNVSVKMSGFLVANLKTNSSFTLVIT